MKFLHSDYGMALPVIIVPFQGEVLCWVFFLLDLLRIERGETLRSETWLGMSPTFMQPREHDQ